MQIILFVALRKDLSLEYRAAVNVFLKKCGNH